MSSATKSGVVAITLTLLLLVSAFSSSHACTGIVIYWGQNGGEGSLEEACNTGLYKVVIIAFLHVFGQGRTPVLNLAGHCHPPSGTCVRFSSQIQQCQRRGIKVLLSLGGGIGPYGLDSTADARQFADYLWNTFLAGTSPTFRPLGPAVLDGVDFNIEGGPNRFYDDLARFLKAYASNLFLTTAPQCPFPDHWNDNHIRTGLFDLIMPQFYNNHCGINGGTSNMFSVWNTWSRSIPSNAQLLMGLPAAWGAAGSGYMTPQQFRRDILPVIQRSQNFGGVMLWSRFFDRQNNFSPAILPVCPNTLINNITNAGHSNII